MVLEWLGSGLSFGLNYQEGQTVGILTFRTSRWLDRQGDPTPEDNLEMRRYPLSGPSRRPRGPPLDGSYLFPAGALLCCTRPATHYWPM